MSKFRIVIAALTFATISWEQLDAQVARDTMGRPIATFPTFGNRISAGKKPPPAALSNPSKEYQGHHHIDELFQSQYMVSEKDLDITELDFDGPGLAIGSHGFIEYPIQVIGKLGDTYVIAATTPSKHQILHATGFDLEGQCKSLCVVKITSARNLSIEGKTHIVYAIEPGFPERRLVPAVRVYQYGESQYSANELPYARNWQTKSGEIIFGTYYRTSSGTVGFLTPRSIIRHSKITNMVDEDRKHIQKLISDYLAVSRYLRTK
jgi:hypothetical protein